MIPTAHFRKGCGRAGEACISRHLGLTIRVKVNRFNDLWQEVGQMRRTARWSPHAAARSFLRHLVAVICGKSRATVVLRQATARAEAWLWNGARRCAHPGAIFRARSPGCPREEVGPR